MKLEPLYDAGNGKGMRLDYFLKKYEDDLKNSRVFYIVKFNREPIFKVGISGTKTGYGAGRLKQYLLESGIEDNLNPCVGTRVFYILKTKRTKGVASRDSYIMKLEDYVKRELDKRNLIARGSERTIASLDTIKAIINSFGGKDEPTIFRRSERVKQLNFI
jgi:hypothetical protein